MDTTTKKWLVSAALLVVLGTMIFALTACSANWSFKTLFSGNGVTNTHEIAEEFSNISIETDTADIRLVLSDDGKCKVVCHERKNQTHSVYVKDGTLVINENEHVSFFDMVSPTITVYLSKNEYTSLLIDEDTGDIEIPKDFKFENVDIETDTGDVKFLASAAKDVKIETDTGDIHVENLSVGSLNLSVYTGDIKVLGASCDGDITLNVSTGKANLSNINCQSFTSRGSSGDISLTNVVATSKLSIVRSTGDVKFDRCDAAEIYVETDTGDVKGTLLSEKVFITETSTGKINVPKTITGGRCEITTSTGNITISIAN